MKTAAIALLMIGLAQAQTGHALHGTVTSVDIAGKRLTIQNEAIEGWMGAMTMAYAVDNPDVLNVLKPGDRITATVYDNDPILHAVAAVVSTTKGSVRLEDLEQMALLANPSMAQARAGVRSATGLARQAGLYPNPTVGYYGDEIRGGYSGGGKQGGFISQTIVLGGKLGAARRVAVLQASEAEVGVQLQSTRIVNNVRALFYHAVAAQRMVEVRRKLVALSADATQTAAQLGNVGLVDRPDILQAEVEQQQAGMNLRVAEQGLETAWRLLASVVGRPDLVRGQLEDELEKLPDLKYEESVANTLRDSPEGTVAQIAVTRAEASLASARKEPIPNLEIGANLVHNFEPLDTTHLATGFQGGAQVGVRIPIFNRNQGAIEAARGQIEGARQDLARVRLRLQRDVAGMFLQYDAARLSAQQYRQEMLPRAEQAFKMYTSNYQNMAAPYSLVLMAQRTLFQLEADYVQALENAWQSAVAIQGFGLMDGLASPARGSGY